MGQVLEEGLIEARVPTSLCRADRSPHNLPQEKLGARTKAWRDRGKQEQQNSEINDSKWGDYSLCRRQALSVSYMLYPLILTIPILQREKSRLRENKVTQLHRQKPGTDSPRACCNPRK